MNISYIRCHVWLGLSLLVFPHKINPLALEDFNESNWSYSLYYSQSFNYTIIWKNKNKQWWMDRKSKCQWRKLTNWIICISSSFLNTCIYLFIHTDYTYNLNIQTYTGTNLFHKNYTIQFTSLHKSSLRFDKLNHRPQRPF